MHLRRSYITITIISCLLMPSAQALPQKTFQMSEFLKNYSAGIDSFSLFKKQLSDRSTTYSICLRRNSHAK